MVVNRVALKMICSHLACGQIKNALFIHTRGPRKAIALRTMVEPRRGQ